MNEVTIENINLDDIVLIHECLMNSTFKAYECNKVQSVLTLIQKLEEVIDQLQ